MSNSDNIKKQKLIQRYKKNLELYDSHDIRNIIYKDIDDQYCYGKFGELKVIIIEKNGYMNVTKLCADSGKDFESWLEIDNYKDLVSYVDNELSKQKDKNMPRKSIIYVDNGNSLTDGTYVHYKLFVHVAAWCSTSFALGSSKIVLSNHIKEANNSI